MVQGMLDLSQTQLSIYRTDKAFGYPLGTDAAPKGIRLRKSRMQDRVGCGKESDAGKSRIHGGHRERKVFVMFVLLLARKSTEENGDRGGRKWTCVATYRRMRERLCWFRYTLVFAVS